ncbi:MAG: NAD(P)-binding protein [bacterium]|nr:NAD(P)-binding protein [bacterium]
MKPVLILGGGLTGLVAAERLAASRVSSRVVEKESEPGGACRTLGKDGYLFDLTGHLLHIGHEVTQSYLEDVGVWKELKTHERRAAIRVGNSVTPYPIQIHTHGLDPKTRRDCLLGFVRAWAAEAKSEPRSFEEWVLEQFGDGLAKHFFFPYNSKLYRAEPSELSLDWVGRYVPKPDLEEVINGALGLHQGETGYNAVFRYPCTGGIDCLPRAVAKRVENLELNRCVTAISLDESWVDFADGKRECFDDLVSTLSLPSLMDMIVDELPGDIAAARRVLRWVRVLNLALGVCGDAPTDQHWLYFPDPALPFYRVGFPSNHGSLAPEGAHTISVEVSLDPEGGDVDVLADQAMQALVGIGMVEEDQVQVRQLAVLDPAYVVFDHRRREAVAKLRKFLSSYGVIISGRWAEWKYSAMEDAILDGMTVARRLCGRAESRDTV